MNFEFRDSDEFRESAKQIEEFKYTLLCLHGLENQDFFTMQFSVPFAITLKIRKMIVKTRIS